MASAAPPVQAAPTPASPAPAADPPQELSAEELAKMSKDERKAYHMARRSAEVEAKKGQDGQAAGAKQQMSKAQRRAVQEAQRKAKEDKLQTDGGYDELLKDLKLQGLTEDQAREVIAEMARHETVEDDDDDDGEVEDFDGSVRRWMQEQDVVSKDALRDFNMKVRFQGHVDTTPPDHLHAILLCLAEQACREVDLSTPKLQPTVVAKKAAPIIAKWAPLLEPLYEKIDDVLVAADVVVRAVSEGASVQSEVGEAGHAYGVVGCLMALRDIDMIEDEDLLTGCKRLEPKSLVMDKFVEFLEEELEDEEDDD